MRIDENMISVVHLCTVYKIEKSFFTNLNDYGILEIREVEKSLYLHRDQLQDLEKIIRLHQELNINFEGIDTVLNLLNKIETLQEELTSMRNQLRLYER
jgi:hypothetical protein